MKHFVEIIQMWLMFIILMPPGINHCSLTGTQTRSPVGNVSRGKLYLFDVSFEVHVNTLSCFAIMSLHVFSSKAQECVHTHIQASLRLLQPKTHSH